MDNLELLKTSYLMYQNQIETLTELNDKKSAGGITSLKTLQDEVIENYIANGGDVDELRSIVTPKTISKAVVKENKTTKVQNINKTKKEKPTVVYDVIPLPSKGQCYRDKSLANISISFLTAYDENLILSPNLYQNGNVITHLIRNKMVDNLIDPMDMLKGDRDAITLWLRVNGYGVEFPATVTDPVTNTVFDTIVDLSTIKQKDFTLHGDENGWFEFTMPKSGDIIKFSFLTFAESLELEKFDVTDQKGVIKYELDKIVNGLSNLYDETSDFGDMIIKKLDIITNTAKTVVSSLENEEENDTRNIITKTLKMLIKSVNGNDDEDFISNYVDRELLAYDSNKFRNFVSQNEPGLDFIIDVEKPENLGGGSFKLFLRFDDFIFLNIT